MTTTNGAHVRVTSTFHPSLEDAQMTTCDHRDAYGPSIIDGICLGCEARFEWTAKVTIASQPRLWVAALLRSERLLRSAIRVDHSWQPSR